MSAPKRIQRSRAKGWRMPEGAIYVGRPTRWGNPVTVDEMSEAYGEQITTTAGLRRMAVMEYQGLFIAGDLPFDTDDVRAALRGHDLACWCPLDQLCHADVLLQLANGGPA